MFIIFISLINVYLAAQGKLNVSKANVAAKMMDFDDDEEDDGYTGGAAKYDNDDFM